MNAELNFIDFVPGRKSTTVERISIMANGGFTFLSAFYKKNNINTYEYVVVSYDANSKAIGFTFTNDKKRTGVFKLSHKNNRTIASIVTTSFWRDFQLNPQDHKGKYPPHLYTKEGREIYYILLSEKEK